MNCLTEEEKILTLNEYIILESDWKLWLLKFFKGYIKYGFGPHHYEFWNWIWTIKKGIYQPSFVGIWPRGGAKSTSAEMGCVGLGARQARKYGFYVCETQDQADDHISNIGSMLESKEIEFYYPALASRLLGKYGSSKGWRRNRLRTASGFTIDAIGLDSAARGAKLDEERPDFMVFDDIDSELDTLKTTQKKIDILTKKLIPAGSNDLIILAIQNLVHPNSIFSQINDGRADFMTDKIVSGPYPALQNMAYEQHDGKFIIVSGTPIWEGQNIQQCQEKINKMGMTAFLTECQQEVEVPPGGLFSHLIYQHCKWDEIPKLIKATLWVDPAVTETDDSDSYALNADGLGIDNKIYRLYSWENRTSPKDALKRAILKAIELKINEIGVETDQGGDTWEVVFNTVLKEVKDSEPKYKNISIKFKSAKAGAGHGSKVHRASQMLVDYEHGQIVHVLGTHQILEKALNRFPKTKPFDLTDASFWSWADLRNKVKYSFQLDPNMGKQESKWAI